MDPFLCWQGQKDSRCFAAPGLSRASLRPASTIGCSTVHRTVSLTPMPSRVRVLFISISIKKDPPFWWILFYAGRGRRTRTLDTRFWRPLLYQLSYTPINMAEKMGFEPMLPLTNTNGLANRPLQPLEYFSLLVNYPYCFVVALFSLTHVLLYARFGSTVAHLALRTITCATTNCLPYRI